MLSDINKEIFLGVKERIDKLEAELAKKTLGTKEYYTFAEAVEQENELLKAERDALVRFQPILDEMKRQDKKWGSQRQHHSFTWLAILTEEVGELAEASLKNEFDNDVGEGNIREELIHVMAVGMQWLEATRKEIEDETE